MRLQFHKYTCLGNHFVVFDFSAVGYGTPIGALARWAADSACGIGADSILVLERKGDGARGRIRFLEPTGDDFLCCGNGLISLGLHLYMQTGVEENYVVGRSITGNDKVFALRCRKGSGLCEATLDFDPVDIFHFVGNSMPANAARDVLTVEFEMPESDLSLKGFVVFTGEPHLVLLTAYSNFDDHGVPRDYVSRLGGPSRFLSLVGNYLNRSKTMFPRGINVSLATLKKKSYFEYRTFERGLGRETLACGTGAMAIAHVAEMIIGSDHLTWTACPLRALLHPTFESEAEIYVTGKTLASRPKLVFTGVTGNIK